MAIFNFFGSILGYLLWFLYTIFRNYGVAIILFTIILKLALFPTSLKQQRSMASQSKLQEKQKELQKKYANNKQKYNDELMKLYEKEGVSRDHAAVQYAAYRFRYSKQGHGIHLQDPRHGFHRRYLFRASDHSEFQRPAG